MDCLSERAESRRERVWGGNGKTPNSLAVFIWAVYHEERGHGLLFPEMNKKIIFSVCFITESHFSQIRADKSFREKRGRVCVCVKHAFVDVLPWSCVSVHPCFLCRCVTAPMFVHVSVCVTVKLRVSRRHEGADGYFGIGGILPEEAWLRRWIRLPVQTS